MLSKQAILECTNNGFDVFRHYIPIEWRLGKNFFNPLYDDRKASCNIYFDRRGRIYKLKDFGNDFYSGDCFAFVGHLKKMNCTNSKDFIEILKIINHDLGLGLLNNEAKKRIPVLQKAEKQLPENRKPKPYIVKEQRFHYKELLFWEQHGIKQNILEKYNVCSVREFHGKNAEDKPYTLFSSKEEPIFGYKGDKFIKLYRPFSQIRFLYGGDIGENYCFGLEQLPAKGDVLFITGGEKDVLSLAAHGFHAICFNSETAHIQEDIIQNLTFRFKHIILLYDVDKTGLEASARHEIQLTKYEVKRLILPLEGSKNEKDISDYFRLGFDREHFLKLFIEFLDSIYKDTMSMLKSCEIDFDNPPMKAQEIISAGDVPLGTQGNILCITGGEGSGKSNYVASLIAGSICNSDGLIDTLGVNISENKNHKAVLLYDTEQSEVQLFKNVSNLLKRAELQNKPNELKAFCLTGMSRKERLHSIVQSMDKFYYEFGGIQLVAIDGIADMVHSANDETECLRVVDELYRLAGIYQTCIVCVLHYVPNGLKLRGHLGSELQRKAAAILSIELDSDQIMSVVKALKVREGSPLDVPLMQFSWDKEAGMHVYRGEKTREEKEKRKENELLKVALEIFERQQFNTYVNLCEQIQQIMDVKERTAKSYIRFMKEKEIILKDPSHPNYYIIGINL